MNRVASKFMADKWTGLRWVAIMSRWNERFPLPVKGDDLNPHVMPARREKNENLETAGRSFAYDTNHIIPIRHFLKKHIFNVDA